MLFHRSVTPSIKFVGRCPFIHLSGERLAHSESKVSCPRTQCPRLVLDPGLLDREASELTFLNS